MNNNYFDEDGKMKTVTDGYSPSSVSAKQQETSAQMKSQELDTQISELSQSARSESIQAEKEQMDSALAQWNSLPDVAKEECKEQMSDEDKASLEQMENYQQELAQYEQEKEKYLVRGAMMHCSCGSHYRRLNLPECHGVYTKERPLMNVADSLPGDALNIPTFGVCSSGKNSTGGSVLLVADVPRDVYGRPIAGAGEGNVKGTPCVPIIVSQWMCPHETTIVGTEPAITPRSFLVCKYQGLIEVVDSGQDDEETLPPK
ncbi:DUF4280 domain-containing protein [Anaeromicropila populeti]|uniref:DUF4280 domain-containing protein n=1 Tax=Anaeromicropila populeti TaxID=37658 RepID=A0A1I6KCI1_9FIRM|nr:DUF4280 domain-containing protein [Anaeromicropila populeti]SFR88995.1 protein of unknown function [Anaeromicropila populeti]